MSYSRHVTFKCYISHARIIDSSQLSVAAAAAVTTLLQQLAAAHSLQLAPAAAVTAAM